MQTTGAKVVSVAGILLIALLAGCSKGNTASSDPTGSSPTPLSSAVMPASVVTGADGVAIDNYALVSSTRISRTVYEYTYMADVSNWGSGDAAITATLASTVPEITVMEGALDFGNVPLGATQESTDTFTIRIDRSKPFNEDALVWTAQATPLPPTTFQLIDQALTDGTIDAETALVYKVFFEFNDSRLPAQYVGRDDQFFEAIAIREAARQFNTLSPATQQILAPFLEFPDFSATPVGTAQSIASPASTTGAVAFSAAVAPVTSPIEVIPGKVYIGWNSGNLGDWANRSTTEIQSNIWAKLTGLLGTPANGKKILILLDPSVGRSEETTSDCVTAKIRLARESNLTLVHELTHALIDLNFPQQCNMSEYLWMQEATSMWAEHFVYPTYNPGGEQHTAPWFLSRPNVSLETYEGAAANAHQYGAYLIFLYMTKGDSVLNSNTGTVKAAWAATSGFDSLHAIDAGLWGQGGLAKAWHEFALYNWNRVRTGRLALVLPAGTCSVDGSPYVYYGNWDCVVSTARESTGATPVSVKLNGAVAKSYPLAHDVKHLSAAYFDYDFSKDDTIRRIRLVQPYSSDSSGNAKVQVIVKIRNKGWQQAVDWTGFQQKTLCRDKPDEDFERVVIVFSNSKYDDSGPVMKDDGTHTKLQVSALGCSNWKGYVKTSYVSGNVNDDISSHMDAENVTFDRYDEVWSDTDDNMAFKVTGGSVSWTSAETLNVGVSCTGSFSGTYSLANTTLDEAILTLGVNGKPDYSIDAVMYPVANGGSWTVNPLDYLLTCPPDAGGYQPPATLIVNEWFSVYKSNGLNVPTLPGIYDTAGGLFDGELAGFATLFTQSPGEEYDYLWELKKNGTFDSDL